MLKFSKSPSSTHSFQENNKEYIPENQRRHTSKRKMPNSVVDREEYKLEWQMCISCRLRQQVQMQQSMEMSAQTDAKRGPVSAGTGMSLATFSKTQKVTETILKINLLLAQWNRGSVSLFTRVLNAPGP